MCRKFASIILIAAMIFSAIPLLGDTADAASYKIKTLNATAKSTNTVSLSWSKTILKASKYSGYSVYRNNKLVKNLGKNTRVYTDKGLKANTTYKYVVKTYKTKKIKQWYNKKTKKWQKRKPSKKYRGKSRTRTTYSYSEPSPVKSVKTKAAPSASTKPRSSSTSATTKPTSPTKEVSQEIRYKISSGETVVIRNGTQVTDFEGIVWTAEKKSDGYWKFTQSDGSFITAKLDEIGRFDNRVNSTFTVDGITYTQKDKVTSGQYTTGTPSKGINAHIVVFADNPTSVEPIIKNTKNAASYTYTQEQYGTEFVMLNGKRLIEVLGVSKTVNGRKADIEIKLGSEAAVLNGVGFVKGSVEAYATIDGKDVGSITVPINQNAGSDGINPNRKEMLALAQKAVEENGGKQDYQTDMRAIVKYVRANCYKGGNIAGVQLDCNGGAAILGTYSGYEYGIYGFASYGTQGPGRPNYLSHVAFHREDNPKQYFETEGSWEGELYK